MLALTAGYAEKSSIRSSFFTEYERCETKSKVLLGTPCASFAFFGALGFFARTLFALLALG